MSSSPPQHHFTLDKTIFNETLYSHLRQFWFADLPANFTGASNLAVLRRWWGADATAEQKRAFDTSCADNFLPALTSLGPEKLTLPPFHSHEQETRSSPSIAGPLLAEVEEANSRSPQQASETLLSLILLLDQMPRNIFRSQTTLPLVYNHYDRLAHALLHSSMKTLTPNPAALPANLRRPALQSWILMPLMHSEALADHELWDVLAGEVERVVGEDGDESARMYAQSGRKAWEAHVDAIRRFGRYPHRNACLGRESSQAEVEWLRTGQTFGVGQVKDEL